MFKKVKCFSDNSFSKEKASLIKGICSLIIIMHHLSWKYYEINTLKIFNDAGFITVGIFLFISGYGIRKKYLCSEYTIKDLFYRLYNVIMPFLFANIIYFLCTFIFSRLSINDIFDFLPYYWYIIEIISFYIISFIIEKIRINLKLKEILLFLISICTIFLLVFFKINSWWYRSFIVFVVGYIFGRKEFKSIKTIYIITMTIATIAFYVISKNCENSYIVCVLSNIVSANFSILLYFFAKYVSYSKKSFLGEISYGIYLYHTILLIILDKYVGKISIFIVPVATILVSYIFTNILNKIIYKK